MDPLALEERLTSLENRLSRIETLLKPSAPLVPKPASPPPPAPVAPPQFHTDIRPLPEEKPGNWLGIIAIICFVLAAGFIIKLSIDSGWLTPTRQLGIAVLFGGVLIVTGFRLLDTDREYASLLPGAGVIVFYMTAFAAHSYYSLIGFEAAIIATGIISGFCIWLYTKIGHDIYAITAALGAYLAPSILGLGSMKEFSLYYFLFCSLAFAVLSVGVQSRLLTMISSYLAIFMTSLIGMNLHSDTMIAAMLATHFMIFATGTYAYTTQTGKTITQGEATGFLPVLLLFYVAEYYFINRVSPGFAPWISLAFAAILTGLYCMAKNLFQEKVANSGFLVTSFVTVACFHSVYLELLPNSLRPWLLAMVLFAVAFVPGSTGALRRDFPIPALAIGAIIAIEYMEILGRLADTTGAVFPLPVAFAALAGIWAMLARGKQEDFGWLLLGAAHILAMFAFYRLTYDYNSLAVSATWLIYAVCVIAFAFLRHDEDMAKSALLVLSIAAGKALIYDVGSAPPIVRILCLLLTGIVLYISGMLMRRISGWGR